MLHQTAPPIPISRALLGLVEDVSKSGLEGKVKSKVEWLEKNASDLIAKVKTTFQSVVEYPNKDQTDQPRRVKWAATRRVCETIEPEQAGTTVEEVDEAMQVDPPESLAD